MKIRTDEVIIVNWKLKQVGKLWRTSRSRWQGVFECDCGQRVICDTKNVITGNTKSCGCLRSEITVKKNKSRVTHGQSGSRAYHVWEAMKQRCMNQGCHAYHYYGGRGIGICETWMTFSGFVSDMGDPADGMTLDRINNDAGYSKDNCRWVTHDVQHRNTRANVMVEHEGKRKCVSEWAREFGMEPETFRHRLKRMSFVEAISLPMRVLGRKPNARQKN